MKFIGYGFVYLGLLFVAIGTLGIFRFRTFYARTLASSKVDIVGDITILIGLIILNGISAISLKLTLIIIILLIINPLISHTLVRSAVKSGYTVRKE
jgi:multicomponent Na+:H+ antiporter subunit G